MEKTIITEQLFIIEDWACNHLFKDKTFKSFEAGWDFIVTNVDNSLYDKTGKQNDDNYQEYFVVTKK